MAHKHSLVNSVTRLDPAGPDRTFVVHMGALTAGSPHVVVRATTHWAAYERAAQLAVETGSWKPVLSPDELHLQDSNDAEDSLYSAAWDVADKAWDDEAGAREFFRDHVLATVAVFGPIDEG